MVEELHEGTAEKLTNLAAGEDPVVQCHEGQQQDEADTDDELGDAVSLPPARQAFVPDGG